MQLTPVRPVPSPRKPAAPSAHASAPRPVAPQARAVAREAQADDMGGMIVGSLLGGIGTWLLAGASGLVRSNPLAAGAVTLVGLFVGAWSVDRLTSGARG